MQQDLGLATHARYDHAERDAKSDHAQNVGVLIVAKCPCSFAHHGHIFDVDGKKFMNKQKTIDHNTN